MQTESIVESDAMPIPFKEFCQVLSYVNERNPARARYPNLLERESSSKVIAEDFGGESPADIYASALHSIKRTLRHFPVEWHHAWVLRNYGPRARQLCVEDIADHYGRDCRTIHRWLRAINEQLKHDFVRRRLLPKPEKENDDG